ncbi:MAG TPA: aspartate aminotransferase family protein [Streptosporangiaceae bacterium]|nr:aspartate aminotransferase family protein [Streptosporangiaceae bacterium]
MRENEAMDFDLPGLLAAHRGDGYELYGRYLNPQQPRMLHAIGFDKVYVRAEGAYLYDAEGHQYADFLAGFGVFAAGRNHPVIRQALHDVLDAHLADWTQFDCGPLPGLLAERLLAKAPGLDRVFFCNSGTEAVESALKFARYATGRGRVIYCDHAFHGLTTGSLSVNGAEEFRRGFGPLLPDTAIPLGDLDALAAELRKGDVAALIIEPVQGHGVLMPADGFLTAAAALLHEHGALLICDEVQSGFGRTGKFFAYQHERVVPDIVTVAKALSGGFVPVGAMLAKGPVFEKVYSSMDRVMVHSTTFKAGVLAMAAGLASLAVLDDEGLVDNAARTGDALKTSLTAMMHRYDVLADVRGRGLMIGLEFGQPSSMRARTSWNMLQKARVGLFAQMVVVALFQRHRILTQVSGDHMEVIKLIPPLMIGDTEVKLFTAAFGEVLEDASKGSGLIWEFGRTLVKQAARR